jgi:hypothetical protein
MNKSNHKSKYMLRCRSKKSKKCRLVIIRKLNKRTVEYSFITDAIILSFYQSIYLSLYEKLYYIDSFKYPTFNKYMIPIIAKDYIKNVQALHDY